MKRIVALHGKPRVGKDEIAKFLTSHHGFARLAFADPIYSELATAYGVTETHLRSHEWKTQPQVALCPAMCANSEFVHFVATLGHDAYQPMTSRRLLQLWGTEYRRAANDNHWVEYAEAELDAMHGTESSVVVTDLREEHEVLFLRRYAHANRYDLTVVEVIRDCVDHGTGHRTDVRLADKYICYKVHNNGTLEQAYQQLRTFLGGLNE